MTMPFPTELHYDRRLHGDLAEIERSDGTGPTRTHSPASDCSP